MTKPLKKLPETTRLYKQINEFELRPCGKWSFIMHGPDKGNYPNECEFIKIDKRGTYCLETFFQTHISGRLLVLKTWPPGKQKLFSE